jgi:hypothetical protein
LHAKDVELLAHRVHLAHEDRAFESEPSGGRRGRHPVLTGTRFGDHAALAHALGEQGLANDVVDLV